MREKHNLNRSWLSQVLFGLSLLCLAFGLINLGWTAWPEQLDAVQLEVPKGVLPGAPSGSDYASLTAYNVSISWPRWIRLGQTSSIQVVINPTGVGEALTQGNGVGQIVLIEPALGLLSVTPAGRLQANLASGQDLNMSWEVAGEQVGIYEGKVYLSFGFYDETLNELISIPVAVFDVTIQVTSLWGQTQPLAIWLGIVGIALWGALFLLGRWVQLK